MERREGLGTTKQKKKKKHCRFEIINDNSIEIKQQQMKNVLELMPFNITLTTSGSEIDVISSGVVWCSMHTRSMQQYIKQLIWSPSNDSLVSLFLLILEYVRFYTVC